MKINASNPVPKKIKPLTIDISHDTDKQKVIQAIQNVMTTHAQEIRALADK